jgi:hypothetical protein
VITSEADTNLALAPIQDGFIGFDTEFVARKMCEEETFIEEIFSNLPGNKRSGTIVWHALQIKYQGGFPIHWDNIGLCIVQISRGDNVWLLNMTRIRGT